MNDNGREVELIECGSNVNLDEENKGRFVQKFIMYMYRDSVKRELDMLIKGLLDIMPFVDCS